LDFVRVLAGRDGLPMELAPKRVLVDRFGLELYAQELARGISRVLYRVHFLDSLVKAKAPGLGRRPREVSIRQVYVLEDDRAGVVEVNISRRSFGVIVLRYLFARPVPDSHNPDPLVFEFQLVSLRRHLERVFGLVFRLGLGKCLTKYEAC